MLEGSGAVCGGDSRGNGTLSKDDLIIFTMMKQSRTTDRPLAGRQQQSFVVLKKKYFINVSFYLAYADKWARIIVVGQLICIGHEEQCFFCQLLSGPQAIHIPKLSCVTVIKSSVVWPSKPKAGWLSQESLRKTTWETPFSFVSLKGFIELSI